MLVAIGGIVVLATVYLMVKQYETRLVLFCSGMLMAVIAGDPMAGFKAFSHAMQENRLFESIISVMGFAMVMKLTECDKHLIQWLAKGLKRVGPLLIPGATLVTFFINTSITSSAGCSAAVGTIIIPLLMAAGIHPAIAAASVYAGTYGAMFNPGYAQIAIVADVAKASPMNVVSNHFFPLLLSGIIGGFSLLAYAYIRKENKNCQATGANAIDTTADFKVDFLRAIVPVIPLAVLILGNMKLVPAFQQLGISHAMIIGVFCAFLVTRVSPAKISKEFWHGVGDSFGHIFGIIICALVFVGGMNAVGLIKALTTFMISNPSIAKVSSAFGPFLLAVMSGSGDAAAVAFNKAVTVDAAKFGLAAIDMGSMAAIGGALGRSMSPVAGGLIICSTIAGVSPMETAKRNAPGMVLACIVTMILLLYK
ncbi:MAG: C4-dicarboxylate anaerobic carrier-like protein [Firmicutes bacterium]|nr:C4-dicarboxylate anaerobic carrier-like protein [Bacillota bacterium]